MDYLLAGFAELSWPRPHHIEAVPAEHVEAGNEYEEPLLPLDGRLMQRIPPLDGREFALSLGIQDYPVEDSQPFVDYPEDSRHWEDYEGLDYIGVLEEYLEWRLAQPEETLGDEINKASQHANLAPKRPEPMTNDNILLQGINASAEAHIATIGIQESPMPDSATPAFGPTLEHVLPQQ